MTTTTPPRKDRHLGRQVRIPDELYERLLREQQPRESLGDTLRRLLSLDDDDDDADLS